jgi:hypothetical protein
VKEKKLTGRVNMMSPRLLERASHAFRQGYKEREQGKPCDPNNFEGFGRYDYKEGWKARDVEIYWFNKEHNLGE